MLKSVNERAKRLPERVAEQIAELIAGQQYQSGDKLPNEFEMAKQLQVGRGTVREAIKLLAARNLVEIRRGCGTFVCDHPGQVKDPLGFSFVPDQERLAGDLYELRMLIEPEIAAMAARRGLPPEIAELKRAAQKVEALCLAEQEHTQADIAFHEQLARCSHNQVMPRLMPVIQSAVSVFVEMTESSLREETIHSHAEIVCAVEAGDAGRAKEAMKEHLQRNWEKIRERIAEAEQEGRKGEEL